jgi:hypothetical protein
MAHPAWRVRGEYFETCSCDYVCPCILTNMSARPTQDACTFAMVFHVDSGTYGSETLDGLNFAVIGRTPGVMAEGNWSVGVVVDERASASQREALGAIASGQAGGPVAALGGLIGTFLGLEFRPIRFGTDGLKRSASIPGFLDEAVEGVPSSAAAGEPLYLDNTLHPANRRLALAHATRSHVTGFGLSWSDTSGRNNGHFAPFAWQH